MAVDEDQQKEEGKDDGWLQGIVDNLEYARSIRKVLHVQQRRYLGRVELFVYKCGAPLW